MICKNCNATLPDDSGFCTECGAKVEVEPAVSSPGFVFCANCGAAMSPDDMFCENCGAKVEAAPAQTEVKAKPAFLEKLTSAIKKIPPKKLKIGLIITAAVLVVAIAAAIVIACIPSPVNYALYIKDKELFYSDIEKGSDALELTSSLISGGSSDLGSYVNAAYSLPYYVHLSEDGKTLFYPDKAVSNYGSYINEFTLYCRDVSSSKSEPLKIAAGISHYEVNSKGTLVTYLKNGTLYQHDLKDSTKISANVADYRVSSDGKSLVYLVVKDGESDGTLYLKKNGKDAEKISNSVTDICWVSDDFKSFVYLKDGDTLYRVKNNGDPEKVATDVSRVVRVSGIDAIYYTFSEADNLTCWDFIVNDLGSNYDGEYANSIDQMINWLQNYHIDISLTTLYYFNGDDSTALTENYGSMADYASDADVVAYLASDFDGLPKIKFSEALDSLDDSSYTYYYIEYHVADLVREAMNGSSSLYIASNGNVSEVDVEADGVENVIITDDGKTVYICADYDGDHDYYYQDTVTVYKASVSKDSVTDLETMDEDVSASYIYLQDDKLIYFMDVYDYSGELFIDGKSVDDEVNMYSVMYCAKTGAFAYLVDVDTDNSSGTLMYYTGGKPTKVKDDVAMCSFSSEGDLLFLYDYSTSRYKGELWIYNGKSASFLDDDVNFLLSMN